MLTQLHIQNFILIEKASLEMNDKLTVITGETGSGKSIIIDAIALLLGARADTSMIGQFQNKCDITACFDLEKAPTAWHWLDENDFAEQDEKTCIIRRMIEKDGKSKQTINGRPCTLLQIKQVLQGVLSLHGQHQHQLLVKGDSQREILDLFGTSSELLEETRLSYQEWSKNNTRLKEILTLQQNHEAQQGLLEYQLTELETLNLLQNEYEELDQEQKQLANAESTLKCCHEIVTLLTDADEKYSQSFLHAASRHLEPMTSFHPKLASAAELIVQSTLLLDEAINELKSYAQHIDVDAERLHEVETRLSKIHELARKFRVSPQNLLVTHEQLKNQFLSLNNVNQEIDRLTEKAIELKMHYLTASDKLFKCRLASAEKLSKIISSHMQTLGMTGGQFKVEVKWNEKLLTANGCDDVEFLVSTNVGHALQPLNKIASGGEISRLALALYVATAERNVTPIIVFDEVDVGIGGSTAAIVGKLLKSLGSKAQVICITHLPQVAAYGDHHLVVSKKINAIQKTYTDIYRLAEEERVTEIARMLGGSTVTSKTIAHAKEMIEVT